MLGQQYLFDFSKPSRLIAKLVQSVTAEEDMILDFFSGSATTAHAVMQLNAEDGGHRKFIMVQLPEATDEKSEAYKAGYKNICETGKERIRRAGQKIRNEQLGIRNDADNSSLLTPNNTIEGTYEESIFTAEKNSQSFDKAFPANKAVQDYVFTDGTAEKSVERRFAEDLDAAEKVCVYAKLPRTFQIPTPVGNYAPDWAIAFYEGTVKHIFFVAETKGTMESLELRPIEQAKISCAKKLFNEISSGKVKYDCVNDYQTLLSLIK